MKRKQGDPLMRNHVHKGEVEGGDSTRSLRGAGKTRRTWEVTKILHPLHLQKQKCNLVQRSQQLAQKGNFWKQSLNSIKQFNNLVEILQSGQ